jgi:hypothetical protein
MDGPVSISHIFEAMVCCMLGCCWYISFACGTGYMKLVLKASLVLQKVSHRKVFQLHANGMSGLLDVCSSNTGCHFLFSFAQS